jgi:hypothetical protein
MFNIDNECNYMKSVCIFFICQSAQFFLNFFEDTGMTLKTIICSFYCRDSIFFSIVFTSNIIGFP